MNRPPPPPMLPGIRSPEPGETPLSWEEQAFALRNGFRLGSPLLRFPLNSKKAQEGPKSAF